MYRRDAHVQPCQRQRWWPWHSVRRRRRPRRQLSGRQWRPPRQQRCGRRPRRQCQYLEEQIRAVMTDNSVPILTEQGARLANRGLSLHGIVRVKPFSPWPPPPPKKRKRRGHDACVGSVRCRGSEGGRRRAFRGGTRGFWLISGNVP
jgi:hypothetical protein